METSEGECEAGNKKSKPLFQQSIQLKMTNLP